MPTSLRAPLNTMCCTASPPARRAALGAPVSSPPLPLCTSTPPYALGTGEEGFEPSPEGYNAAYWTAVGTPMLRTPGTSYARNTASPFIDFASVHFYPEAWCR
ncbi:MAG TPA: hypothetical protein VEU50_02750 [Archangium sp.]|nr:hypothetical protein [Archangium sp.]